MKVTSSQRRICATSPTCRTSSRLAPPSSRSKADGALLNMWKRRPAATAQPSMPVSTDRSPARRHAWQGQLANVFNRGFGTGFLYGIPGPEDSTIALPINKATKERIRIGEVVGHELLSKDLCIRLTSGDLAVNEDVIIEGPESYGHLQVSELRIQGVPCQRAAVGSEVVILTDCQPTLGDQVMPGDPSRSEEASRRSRTPPTGCHISGVR